MGRSVRASEAVRFGSVVAFVYLASLTLQPRLVMLA